MRLSADTFAAVICAKRDRVLTPRDAQVVPVQLVRSGFVAHPIAFSVAQWAGVETDYIETSARESLQEHAARRPNPHDADIYFLVAPEAAHGCWELSRLV